MALLRNASPSARINTQLPNPSTSPQNINLSKAFENKKEHLSSTSPAKPLSGMASLKFKQGSAPTINIPVSNKAIQNSHPFTHKKQPTLDNLNSLSNIKINSYGDKVLLPKKSSSPSLLLNTSQSNEPPSPASVRMTPSSVTNFSKPNKLIDTKLIAKVKKAIQNP